MFSGIFKDLDVPVELLTLNLPDFTRPVVDSLVQFLYSGSVVLDSSLRDDFIALCYELRISVPEEVLATQPVATAAEFMTVKNEDDAEMLVEDYEQNYIERLEPDDENFDEVEDGTSSTQNYNQEDSESPTSQPLITQIEKRNESRQPKSMNISPNSSVSHASIQEALADIANGLNTMEAARRYGIPKTTLYRWVKKAKVK